MRRIVSVSFVVVLFINLFGYFISFSFQRYKIRAEVKQMLKLEKMKHTQHFVFTEAEYKQLHKYEGGKEFSLNGGMYDVVKKELKDARIILTAYYDHQETGLLSKLVSYFNEETKPVTNKHIVPLFSLLEFVFSPVEWKQDDLNTRPLFSSTYQNELRSVSFEIASPPPDFLFS